MNARSFLILGLIAGLFAGLVTFVVAHQVGEPSVEAAIALEQAHSASPADPVTPAEHATDAGTGASAPAGHEHDEGAAEVSRGTQRTWGLLTGTVTMGFALGGVLGLVAAAVAGRLGTMGIRQSTTLAGLLGFVSFAFVPFLKYPATPPAVGNADTIGSRTGLYFGFVLVSVAAAVLGTWLAVLLSARMGSFVGVLAGAGSYLVVMVVAGVLFPTVNEIGDFPADTLWSFRMASLTTLATLWGVMTVTLAGLLGRAQDRAAAAAPVPQPALTR